MVAAEVAEWRWRNGKVFRVEKGRYVWIARSKPWHWREHAQENWRDIDNSWAPSELGGFTWQMTNAPYKVWIADSLLANPFCIIEQSGVQQYRIGGIVMRQGSLREVIASAPAATLALPTAGSRLVVPKFYRDWMTLEVVADTGSLRLRVVAPQDQLNALPRPAGFTSYGDVEVELQLVPVLGAGMVHVMTDYYGETADGQIHGTASLYTNARADSDGNDTAGSTLAVGQKYEAGPLYYCYRLFFSFDTSAIDDAHDVVSATFYAKANTDVSDTDFLVELYRYAWSEPLASSQEANYDGAYGGSATLEGTFRNTADGWSSGTYYSLAVAAAGINKTGDTKYTLVSKRDVDGTNPSGNEYVYVSMADTTSTDSDPYLAITTQVPGFAGMF